jgi:hypothetical protein
MDPISFVFLLYLPIKLECRYRSQKAKMLAYKTAFEGTSALVSDIDFLQTRLSSHVHPELRERIDRELKRTRWALKNAWPLVYSKRSKRAFQEPGTVKVYMQLLDQCRETLLRILDDLMQLDGRHPRPEKYFQELRTRMFAALASQIVRNATLYSGAGDQTRPFKPEAPPHGICLLQFFWFISYPVPKA